MNKLLKGAKKYRDSLDASSAAQQSFCKVLREFCGDVTDEESMDIGAGVIIRYISAFNEFSSFYDLLRSQVNLLMIDQLNDVLLGPMGAVRDGKKRVERSAGDYDAARRKFLSLQRTTQDDVVAQAEKDLRRARSTYDADRFGLARTLLSIHHTKRSFFVETTSGLVDAHMRFFKQGFDLIRLMEPFIHESLGRVQDWRQGAQRDMDLFDDRIAVYLEGGVPGERPGDDQGSASSSQDAVAGRIGHRHQRSVSHGSVGSFTNQVVSSPRGSGPVQMSALQSQMAQEIEASMRLHHQKGKVGILKQGYLLKRSSNLRGDWKSRFFVLDSNGSLYYYTKNLTFIKSNQATTQQRFEQGHAGVPHETVELLTSTVKLDADDDDQLRFCFRIVSPMRTYTLQAESEQDRQAWVCAIQCVIASLLNGINDESGGGAATRGAYASPGLESALSTHSIYTDVDADSTDLCPENSEGDFMTASSFRTELSAEAVEDNPVLDELRSVPGNACCADCGAPMPDWASLNLTVTLCIECSGTHRKLGVHVSKVRSITLDDSAWDETTVRIFKSAGNEFVNSILEKRIKESKSKDDSWLWNADDNEPVVSPDLSSGRGRGMSILQLQRKPTANDPLAMKEEFIRAKYVQKAFKDPGSEAEDAQENFWNSILSADYRGILGSILLGANPNESHGHRLARSIFGKREKQAQGAATAIYGKPVDSATSGEGGRDLSSIEPLGLGLTALHVMSELKDRTLLQLLSLWADDINAKDALKRTPVHYCILNQWDEGAKVLLNRGADRGAVDVYGLTPLEMAMGRGSLTDEDLFGMLAQGQ